MNLINKLINDRLPLTNPAKEAEEKKAAQKKQKKDAVSRQKSNASSKSASKGGDKNSSKRSSNVASFKHNSVDPELSDVKEDEELDEDSSKSDDI